ncbi:MAG: hypothetical protein ABIL77_02670 [candidate division WOR-3 bacterium]
MGKRIPDFWKGQNVDFKRACIVVEEVYKRCFEEIFGVRKVRWVKLLDCKDDRKRKKYYGVIVSFLSNFANFFDGVVFDEGLLREVVYDVVREAIFWYKDYFVFSFLASEKVFEIFELRVLKRYGSIERYVELKKRGRVNVVKIDEERLKELEEIELRVVDDGLFSF